MFNSNLDKDQSEFVAQASQYLSGQTQPKSGIRRFRKSSKRFFRATFCCLAIFLLGNLLGATWSVFSQKEDLLRDNFDDNHISSKRWNAYVGGIPNAGIQEKGGVLILENRGYLVTAEQFQGPKSISFKFQFIDGAKNPQFADSLSIGIKTDGIPRDWSHELSQGILFTFSMQKGNVEVLKYLEEQKQPQFIGKTSNDSLPFQFDQWYEVEIVDDGSVAHVFLRGPGLPKKYCSQAVISVTFDDSNLKHDRIAIYNREYVASTQHETHIDDFAIRLFPK